MIFNGKTKSVTLILTQQCNLSCVYCYESKKTFSCMSFATAQKILYSELTANDSTEFVDINLFGGEPFLQFDLIRQITDFLLSNSFPKKWNLSTITNGTLVHDEIQEWLISHRNIFSLSLSLDGSKRSHDLNRNNSFDQIDLAFFKNFFDTRIKMTISQYTLPALSEDVIFLHSQGFSIANNLAYGIPWDNPIYYSTLISELEKLIEYYIKHPDISECSMLSFPYMEISRNHGKFYRNCSAGHELHAYDTDGVLYPCHMLTPFSVGMEKAPSVNKIVFPDNELDPLLLDNHCYNCSILSSCQTCYASNFIEFGNIYHRNPAMCKINRIIFHAKASLYAQKWDRKLLSLSLEEEKALLDAIQLVEKLPLT